MSGQRVAQPAAGTAVPAVLAIVGSFCGTLVVDAFGDSPGVRLAGAAVGAAVPPLISTAGRYHRLRVSVGMGLAALALLITYGGFTFFDFATNRPATFPLPPGIPAPDQSGGFGGSGAVSDQAGGRGIEVTSGSVRCTASGCEPTLTVTSTGSDTLRIDDIAIDGAAAANFGHSGDCERRRLVPGETCTMVVQFTPSGTGGTLRARLVIHQNLPGDPTFVELQGEDTSEPRPSTDLVAETSVECVHQRGGAVGGRDALQVFFPIRLTGATPDQLPGLVGVSARSDTGLAADLRSAVGNQGQTVAALPLRSGDYDGTHAIVVSVDPGDEVAERDEDNNRIRVTVNLPAQPGPSQPLPCTAERA